jgi:hypothetical protein
MFLILSAVAYFSVPDNITYSIVNDTSNNVQTTSKRQLT